jgi:nitroreductase
MKPDLLKARRSVRKYENKPVPEDVIDEILECGRLAPTARNAQPWLIGAVSDKQLLQRLADLTDHGKFIADCGVCFAVFCKKDEKYYLEDGCAAAMNIIHACIPLGLGSCWVAGDKKPYADSVRQLLNVPESHTLVALVSAGYPGEKNPPKDKKPQKLVIFKNKL